MTLTSGIFNSVNGDRKYNAQWFASYFSSFIANGIFPNPSTNLQVVEGTNMQTVVKVGKGWINGYYLINDSDYILQHDVADGVLKRIDRVVMRLNYLTRQIEVVIKKGIYASTPVAPSLQRDTDAYELALADVLINNGVTQITQANITDQRLNNAVCGIVHGTVNQVDTTTLFNQYQSWFDSWTVEQQQEFQDWVDSLKDILSGDVAANLASRLTTLEQRVNEHLAEFATFKSNTETTIGNETLPTSAKTLKGAIAEVFQSGNNVKRDMVDALLSVDPSLPISYESTWEEIEIAAGQISTGKKTATGSVVSTSNGVVLVTGLDFQPAYIMIEISEGLTGPTRSRATYMIDSASTMNDYKSNYNTVSTLQSKFQINQDGFRVALTNSAGQVYKYFCCEA